jgi:hypothetical protein
LLHRLRQQIELTADPALLELQREVSGYPIAPTSHPAHSPQHDWVIVPLRIRTRMGVLSFISTTMVFGTPVDITLSELAIETFFPADHETVAIVRDLSA